MRVTASVFVDHQEEVKYPIDYVTRNLDFVDAIHLFGSDSGNSDWMRSMKATHRLGQKMEVHEIGVKVNAPVDIALAQNACMDWIRSNETFDYHLLLQADTTLTTLGVRNVRKFMGSGDPDRPVVMQKINHIRMHMDAGRTHFGIALIGKGSGDSKFVGDGAYTENYWVSSGQDDIWHAMDVSYLSVDGYARKMGMGGRIWKDTLKAGLFWEYRENPKEFLKIALRDMVYRELVGKAPKPMSQNDDDYMDTVRHFHLEEERAEVLATLEQVIKEGPETCAR